MSEWMSDYQHQCELLRADNTRLPVELAEARDLIREQSEHLAAAKAIVIPLNAELAAANEKIAELAAALDEMDKYITPEQRQYGKPPSIKDAPAILAADRKAQRAKGAAWALRMMRDEYLTNSWEKPWIDGKIAAIERGEAEVPGE